MTYRATTWSVECDTCGRELESMDNPSRAVACNDRQWLRDMARRAHWYVWNDEPDSREAP
jgi:hypothetical protein